MSDVIELKDALKIRTAMEEYQDSAYINIMRKINAEYQGVFSDDLGHEFVKSCGRDIAGEVVRNCFNTSDYYLTVDQLAKRILEFSYEEEYDPLSNNMSNEQVAKNVYAYNDLANREFFKDNFKKIGVDLQTSPLEYITKELIDANQSKLFEKEQYVDKNGKTKSRYVDHKIISDGKDEYFESVKNEDGSVTDEYTGLEGEYVVDKRGVKRRRQEVDHVQAAATARYNSRYITDEGVGKLKLFYNSADNFAMMDKTANESKGDVRVYDKDGNDITHRASAEQIADAVCERWENVSKEQTRETLKKYGYLDENDKVPKSVKKQLVRNIRHSQNEESKIILSNTNYNKVSQDAISMTKSNIGKIIAGQIIYYSAPPVIFEIKKIVSEKDITLENAIDKISNSMSRVTDYVVSKLKNIFVNITVNSLKTFVKSFMDILIESVKATIRKLLKIAKNVVLSTVDAVRIIADPQSSRPEKANAVCNLYAVTITSCVVEVLFELAAESLHIPSPFDDVVFGPLQILTTVICTNLTLLILKKADLFNVEFGFKMSKIRKLFEESRKEYEDDILVSSDLAENQISRIIEEAKIQSKNIYDNLMEFDPHKDSVRSDMETINKMFSMNIDFEAEWLRFIGISV